jgi:hypothetical protein
MSSLESFERLPKDYKEAVNRIIKSVMSDKFPEMNDAFRVWQAEIFLSGALEEEKQPDPKLFEIEALSFQSGWKMRELKR